MNKLVFLLFFAIFITDYLTITERVLPRSFALLPEAISALTLIVIILRFTLVGRLYVSPKYLLFFLLFFLHILAGIIINNVDSLVIVSGIRNYFKYIPFFVLPLIYPFTDKEMRTQLLVLLGLALMQLPVALFQRLIQYAGKATGDVVRGTVGTSGVLSAFLLCVIAVLISYYIRQRIKLRTFVVFMLMLFIPTTINETKITVILLPMVLFLPLLALPGGRQKLRKVMPIIISGALLFAIFVPIYSAYRMQFKGEGLFDFIFAEGKIENYLVGGGAEGEIKTIDPNATSGITGLATSEAEDRVGRFDSILLPIRVLGDDDPVKLWTGYGIANVSESFLPQFSGAYSSYFKVFGVLKTTLSHVIWELGIGGVFFTLWFFYLVNKDAKSLRNSDGIVGPLAIGWTAVIAVHCLLLIYFSVIIFHVLGYLFWLYSGYIASQAYMARYRPRARIRAY